MSGSCIVRECRHGCSGVTVRVHRTAKGSFYQECFVCHHIQVMGVR